MATNYAKDIETLLQKFRWLPKTLVIAYLRLQYGMTQNLATQTLYNVARTYPGKHQYCSWRQDDDANVFLNDYVRENEPVTSKMKARARAFRVALEFFPEGMNAGASPAYPWVYNFVANNKIVCVADIADGEETITVNFLRKQGVSEEEREITMRIAIVASEEAAYAATGGGFVAYCVVDSDYDLTIVRNVDPAEAWEGVAL